MKKKKKMMKMKMMMMMVVSKQASKLPFIRECMSVAHMTTYKMKKYMANNYKEISKQLMFNN